jgi:Flp pilus assembly protein TadG
MKMVDDAQCRRMLGDESGQSVLFIAFFLGLVALGFVAFALDVGNLFRERQMAQSAANAAVVAAAEQLGAGDNSNEQTIANDVAKLNGFDTTLGTNPATVTLTTPGSGNFTGSYVQATVSKPIKTYFMGAFSSSLSTVTVAATAIAGGGVSSQTCVCTNGALTMLNGATLDASGCGFMDNSSSAGSISVTGSTIDGASFASASTGWNLASGGNTINVPADAIVAGESTNCTPTLPTAPTFVVGSCITDPGAAGGTHTFGPANASSTICYKGLTMGANGGTSTLNPGTYVIYGNYLSFDYGSGGYSNLGGNGVFFYLTNGAQLTIQDGANVNLVSGGATKSGGGTAPSVGAYDGILIYQPSSDTSTLVFDGGSTSFMNGAIIAPGANVVINNGAGATAEGGLVTKALSISSGGSFKAITDTTEGSLVIYSANPKLVQ